MTDTADTLDGKVLLVTGGGKNLGRQVALRAARRGAAVVVNVRTDGAAADEVVAEIEAEGGRALAAVADVTDPTAVRTMVDEARRVLGPPTILVHGAVYRSRYQSITELSPHDWEQATSVALDGAFHCIREVAGDMIAAGYGRVLLVSGSAAHVGLPMGVAHGASAKAGLSGLVRGLAHELGPAGIACNVVVSGVLDTARSRQHRTGEGWDGARSSTLGRMIDPAEVADLLLALCGPGGNIVSGQTIVADGGVMGF